jgi:plasmid stability protein
MSLMANVHIRELPPDTLEALKAGARRHRRSLNAEIVDALVDHATRLKSQATLLERMEEGRRRYRGAFPDGFPPGLEPETTIRRDRERDDLS